MKWLVKGRGVTFILPNSRVGGSADSRGLASPMVASPIGNALQKHGQLAGITASQGTVANSEVPFRPLYPAAPDRITREETERRDRRITRTKTDGSEVNFPFPSSPN